MNCRPQSLRGIDPVPRPTDIDRLYGLEPVIEPAAERGNEDLEQFVELACPCCAEPVMLRLDLTAGDQSYIEDCQVCCQPIQVVMQVGADGQLAGITAARLDL